MDSSFENRNDALRALSDLLVTNKGLENNNPLVLTLSDKVFFQNKTFLIRCRKDCFSETFKITLFVAKMLTPTKPSGLLMNSPKHWSVEWLHTVWRIPTKFSLGQVSSGKTTLINNYEVPG